MSDDMPPLASALGLFERFWSKVDLTGDCWEWTGSKHSGGYGRVTLSHNGTRRFAHRVVWQLMVGAIPRGYEIDHLCFNPPCVNPDHLEAVTKQENLRRRRWGPWAEYRNRKFCGNGHEYTEENTIIEPNGWRGCRQCNYEAWLRRRASGKKTVGTKPCTEPGCPSVHYAKGLCHSHYQSARTDKAKAAEYQRARRRNNPEQVRAYDRARYAARKAGKQTEGIA